MVEPLHEIGKASQPAEDDGLSSRGDAAADPPTKPRATPQATPAGEPVDEQLLETGSNLPAEEEVQGANKGQNLEVSGPSEVTASASSRSRAVAQLSPLGTQEGGAREQQDGQLPINASSTRTGGQPPIASAQTASTQADEQLPVTCQDRPINGPLSDVTAHDNASKDKTRQDESNQESMPRQDKTPRDEAPRDFPDSTQTSLGDNDDQATQAEETTGQMQRGDNGPGVGEGGGSPNDPFNSATPPLTQVDPPDSANQDQPPFEPDGPGQDSRYGTVAYYSKSPKGNLLAIVAYATGTSPPEYFFFEDQENNCRLAPGSAVRFWGTNEPYIAGKRHGWRTFDFAELNAEELEHLTATNHPRSKLNQIQLGTRGKVASRRINGRLVNGIWPDNNDAMGYLYFNEAKEARRFWPPPGTAVITHACVTSLSEEPLLVEVHLQEEQFKHMARAIPRALMRHMEELHLPIGTVTAMIGGDASCDLPARNLMCSRALRGHGDVPLLLREMGAYSRAQLLEAEAQAATGQVAGSKKLQRLKERRALLTALERGVRIVLFVSTPFCNKFQWKALFDKYFSRISSGPTVSQVLLLTDFDARAVCAEQPYTTTDLGEMITLDPGTDSTESFLVFTNPMPWEDDYKDDTLSFVASRAGRKLYGLWRLSVKGCDRSRSATGFPPLN